MGLSFCHIPRFPNTPPRATHLSISQTATIQSLELENARNLSKKSIESEKITKTLDKLPQ